MKALLLACLLATCCQTFGLEQAVVNINARGIKGTIKFITVDETSTRIVVDLTGLEGEQGWHVHQLPIDQTVSPDLQCLSSWAGPHYDPTMAGPNFNPNYGDDCSTVTPELCEYGDLAGRLGPLPMSGQLDETDSTGHITLSGPNSIVGRSVVIHERGTNLNFECGTIRHQKELDGAEVTILQSVFVSPVAGRMYFKQVDGLPDVQIWGKLYYVDDSAATVDHNWHVHLNLPVEDYRIGVCGPDTAGPHYDPTMEIAGSEGYSERCTPETPMGCEVGDLTGKLDTINVAAVPNPYNTDAFFFTDTYLNLTGFQPIIDRSIVVHVPDRGPPRLACAPLVEAETLTLASYRKEGVKLASFSQYSRYQDTIINLGNLPSLDGTDNADLTIVAAALGPNTPCPLDGDAAASDSTYKPRPPVPNVDTPDGYALGDLSGAYGDAVTSFANLSVFDLPVFGARTTISGRTVRYTYGNRRICSALLPPTDGDNYINARASFGGRDIGGNIFFFQERPGDVVTGSTFIIVDIYYLNNTMERTDTHNWHIHQNEPVADMECANVIGGHYNPFSVSLLVPPDSANSNYAEDCNGNYQLRCESGDMSGKHGQLEIASSTDENRPTFSYVDNNLELGGEYTIVGRSVGLHLPSALGGALFDCAAIEEFEKSDLTIMSSVAEANHPNRVEFAKQVSADVDSVSANDILILRQSVSGGCVVTSMKVLAPSQMQANVYAGLVATAVEANYNSCVESSGGPGVDGASLALLSLPLLLLSLMVTYM